MTVYLDTETTGLPEMKGWGCYPDYRDTLGYANARVIQVGAIFGDKEFSMYVKPDGYTIENTFIHGITTSFAEENGKPFTEVAEELRSFMIGAKEIAGYNIDFDYHVLMAELCRYHLDPISLPRRDVMKKAKTTLNLYKHPKLVDLHYSLFKETFAAHCALQDCKATKRCDLELDALK
jgi:DNA polymerase-3 subunit alpha